MICFVISASGVFWVIATLFPTSVVSPSHPTRVCWKVSVPFQLPPKSMYRNLGDLRRPGGSRGHLIHHGTSFGTSPVLSSWK